MRKDPLDPGATQQAEEAACCAANGLMQPILAFEDAARQLGEVITASPAMALHERFPRLVRDVGRRALSDDRGATVFDDVQA
ncbi:hypothetical protein SAV14893_030980 [Streptomyces avermitilis]|uniref:Uncharacterized protein n=1 Tax=Streptomyces avermitilis TaxID=33903 RepID=A0A4D4LRT6_STRAX|nr:hypothetical protein SAVMC3_42950 [Streptomyces avermitilis]GDY63705.1 hypothetical protein SAV14893_030980 [Streptomyces avermitilis]GDY76154.1 hypothetical protein SAV31267_056390 [Streptomyces avermitilis]GDY85099.1 hypothetical protein SAVCW2_42980 [Streptomyces avermitilis]